MLKTSRFCFALAALGIGVATTTPLQAQPVSDMDRAAARDLFREGVELQRASRFAEALDRFTRANSVVNAPTNMLRIAECHAALGHLVEALEMYRALQRYPMPPSPPPAFVQAVEQGREEMKTIEPRVPELKIDVTPPQVPTLSVTIDEQPLHSALVGVSRPINPGVHKVVATAPGYTRAEQTVDVKERARQAISLNLTSTGGVIYGPVSATTNSQYVQISPASGSSPSPIDKPPAYTEGEKPRPATDLRSRTSFFLGPRISVAIPAGKFVTEQGGVISMGDLANPGAALGAEAGIRFARLFYFSALIEGAKYGEVKQGATKYDASSFLAAGKFGLITNPDGFAFIADIGIGYRSFSVDGSVSSGGTTAKGNNSASSADFLLGVGMHFKAGKILRLIPKIDVSLGTFGDSKSNFSTNSTTDSTSHALWTIGLAGYFDINLDKRAAAAPTPALPPP
ncbi:hypothetical protein LVJ94_13335 [Pendulispora rubella]|uniref:PEGA domain-containing protein n=1 Tax=Pendulispora rubella TaxID=2741070 RepID=A0ABZ2LBC3_9BACT